MRSTAVRAASLAAVAALAIAGVLAYAQTPGNPVVIIETSKGNITAELFRDKAPQTVENVLGYVKSGFYKGTIFHRVIKGFMIQGGGFTAELQRKQTRPPITNESDNGLSNARGTLAMARTSDLNSATSQFFINTVDNTRLDPLKYAVFGKVLSGLNVVEEIEAVPTTTRGGMANVPVTPVTILSIRLK